MTDVRPKLEDFTRSTFRDDLLKHRSALDVSFESIPPVLFCWADDGRPDAIVVCRDTEPAVADDLDRACAELLTMPALLEAQHVTVWIECYAGMPVEQRGDTSPSVDPAATSAFLIVNLDDGAARTEVWRYGRADDGTLRWHDDDSVGVHPLADLLAYKAALDIKPQIRFATVVALAEYGHEVILLGEQPAWWPKNLRK